MLAIDEHHDAACGTRLTYDRPSLPERDDHLVNGRRAAEWRRVRMDESEVLSLSGRNRSFNRRSKGGRSSITA
jgi:hypothetical protein